MPTTGTRSRRSRRPQKTRHLRHRPDHRDARVDVEMPRGCVGDVTLAVPTGRTHRLVEPDARELDLVRDPEPVRTGQSSDARFTPETDLLSQVANLAMNDYRRINRRHDPLSLVSFIPPTKVPTGSDSTPEWTKPPPRRGLLGMSETGEEPCE